MQIGDSRKALVLGVIAVAIVGVAVFRLLPKSASGDPSSPQEDVPSSSQDTPDGFPASLDGSPFSHPLLGTAIDGADAGQATGVPEGGAGLPDVGSFPPGIYDPGPLQVGPEAGGGAGGVDPEPPVTRKRIALVAVMGTENLRAIVECDDESVTAIVGTEICEEITVVGIDDWSITIETPDGTFTIRVGEELEI